jgi:hypothetical protein
MKIYTLLTVLTLSLILWFVPPALAQGTQAKAIIKKVAREQRLGTADTNALIILCRRESGYNARCITGSYRGLFQIKLTRYNRNKWHDPYFNTRMAIKQIRYRYKTPRRALSHSYRYGWY